MRNLILASTMLLPLAFAAPAFSQGSTMSPPSPNAGNTMPQSPDSVPQGARTMPRGTTGMEQMGTVGRTRYGTAHRRRHLRRRAHNPDLPEGRTVPEPQAQ
jgi:hypothetical protein